MSDPKPFLIRHADGRVFELAGDAAGKAAYRETYMPQGFAVVDPQPVGYERPDLSQPKPKAEPKAEANAEKDTK